MWVLKIIKYCVPSWLLNKTMKSLKIAVLSGLLLLPVFLKAQVVFEREVKVTDIALHFDGVRVNSEDAPNSSTAYDYKFGPQISAHGDCIATYKEYVFMTWYKGGKDNRHMMLTRYNTETGTQKTIEFPHQHTGWRNIWYIGESHNTIGVGVSPIDGTVHLLFDMHAYSRTRPTDGSLANDYFRYSYSKKNVADVSDEDFTIDQFVKDSDGDYTHLSLNGAENHGTFSEFTYPKFFTNNQGDLFFSMRKGSSSNGGYHFAKYDANTSSWSSFIKFADKNASSHGQNYNWGMYGRVQYAGGKIRIGFQRRSNNKNDKYLYQNGFYYAYSDDQSGQTNWKNVDGEPFSTPLRDADKILVYEPGNLVETTQKDQVYMVGGFDWTVTDRGDVHIIGRVKDNENNITKNVHAYKKSGDTDFTTSTDFTGGERLYTSGDNIYMIGLNSAGRIFIEKSEGGTNNFTKVYEATSGKRFRHGRAHISEGKLYYYMMEQASGDQRPLYLQIIDLGIVQDPFRVSLTSPFDGETYDLDEVIEISADAVNENGSISKVQFFVDGQLYDEDSISPYTVDWSSSVEGVHTIQAVAFNDNDETVSSIEKTIQIEGVNHLDLTGGIYRLRNVATGEFLTSNGSEVIGSESGEGQDKQWQFVKSGMYYNIESETDRGILRASGGANSTPYAIINTGKAAPATDVDKVWTIHYFEFDKTYRFEAKESGRFLYHQTDGEFYNLPVNDSDARSKWQAISISESLSISKEEFQLASIKIYPNPSDDKFIIAFNGFSNAKVRISDILGKVIYKTITSKESIELSKADGFSSGLYIIQVSDENGQLINKKLMIK